MLNAEFQDYADWLQNIKGAFNYWGAITTDSEYDYYLPKFSITFKCAGRPWTLEFRSFTWLTLSVGTLARAFTSMDKEVIEKCYFKDLSSEPTAIFDSVTLILGKQDDPRPIKLIVRNCKEATIYTSPEPPREMLL